MIFKKKPPFEFSNPVKGTRGEAELRRTERTLHRLRRRYSIRSDPLTIFTCGISKQEKERKKSNKFSVDAFKTVKKAFLEAFVDEVPFVFKLETGDQVEKEIKSVPSANAAGRTNTKKNSRYLHMSELPQFRVRTSITGLTEGIETERVMSPQFANEEIQKFRKFRSLEDATQ